MIALVTLELRKDEALSADEIQYVRAVMQDAARRIEENTFLKVSTDYSPRLAWKPEDLEEPVREMEPLEEAIVEEPQELEEETREEENENCTA